MNEAQKATLEKIAVMQDFLDGKEIDVRDRKSGNSGDWRDTGSEPFWNWGYCDYRARQEPVTYPTVDWSIFADGVQWIAWDESGHGFAFATEPRRNDLHWETDGEYYEISSIKLDRGTFDWKDSKIQRPQSN